MDKHNRNQKATHRKRSKMTKMSERRVLELVLVFCVIVSWAAAAVATSARQSQTGQQHSDEATRQAPSPQEAPRQSNCSSPCSSSELAHILAKISANEDVLSVATTNSEQTKKQRPTIRLKCLKQLVGMIKDLASGELEMKTLLEFASSTLPMNQRLDLSSLRSSYASDRSDLRVDLSQKHSGPCTDESAASAEAQPLLGEDAPGGLSSADDKTKFLPKFFANVDHWIDTLERFTLTREWTALMRIFNGAESILSMFVRPSGGAAAKGKSRPVAQNGSVADEAQRDFLAKLERNLPVEVQTLASSLNQLFPWHVWPWNNVDLYSTLDTFLNHGIFAFSKTTSGPERRIDYLSLMLERLFKSMRYDSFPKRCNDWSKIICDLDSFHERLVLVGEAPTDQEESTPSNSSERQRQVRELSAENNNKLTQELTCIMFSSLSMQQFGAKDKVDFKAMFDSGNETLAIGAQLQWDKQVRKALRLYRLSREALTDEQWRALYNQAHDAWSKTKISDRVIMLGRIVQLLTNCHMPKEILESALWKDIYKYKNALNQISDIVIEELNRSSENGKFTIKQLSIGSKHLEDILTRFLRLLPRLIESISRTIVDGLPELVNKFFNEKVAYLKGPCKGYSFADLLPSFAAYSSELVELELLVCKQLRTKPSITMAQINNFTNEFLAMVFSGNFSGSLGGSLQSFAPKFWAAPVSGAIQKVPQHKQGPVSPIRREDVDEGAAPAADAASKQQAPNTNGTSIIDELALNPRLAQIVAILQSSALDPPEVHAELPELDWVEAGTSVALLYETIQKLMSFEGVFTVFPEIPSFQEEISQRAEASKQLFKRFGRQGKVHLVAYGLDTAMPVALRTFQPLDSFHSECLSTFRDIFGDVGSFEGPASGGQNNAPNVTPRESRQWQCAVSSTNFASFALNNLIRTFNLMLTSIMNQMSQQRHQVSAAAKGGAQTNNLANPPSNYCVLFDGSITTLLDNLPQIVDLSLETVLIASTSWNQQQQQHLTLKDTLCSNENQTLDPFGDQAQLVRQQKLRQAICHLLHESSLATCGEALKVSDWTSTMKELNVTWFEASATSVEPSFRGILLGVNQFLDLFAKVKPSSMSDGLIARVLNFSSYWTTLVNKAVSSFEKYREKRFELALQVLVPIIGDKLVPIQSGASREESTSRRTLKLSVLGAKSVLEYLGKPVELNATATISNNQTLEQQLKFLFDWADRYTTALAETLLRTAANNVTKLERLTSEQNSSLIWSKFCSSPVETYFEFEPTETASGQNKAALPTQARHIDICAAKEALCQFEWAQFDSELLRYGLLDVGVNVSSSAPTLDHYSNRQLVRVVLTKWGQVLDLIMESGSKRATRLPKFLTLAHWQSLQEKLPQITPLKEEPTNFTWIWKAMEQLVLARDSSASNDGGSSVHEALVKTFDQLNCALDSVKGGITWDNIANIYQDRQDILAAHSILNNGIELASAGANTFLAHKKFQRFLNDFVKPKIGLSAFCDMRDKGRLETIFVAPDQKQSDLSYALESFQEFICDTNLETLVQNLNPIAFCYQTGSAQNATANTTSLQTTKTAGALTDTMDRFFKLASLAILDAKLVETIDTKPPIFDKSQWDRLRNWWLNQTEVHQGNSGLALTLVRVFQTLDSINSEHVVWRAIFRSVYELSEVSAYLLRAAELERNQAASVEQNQAVVSAKSATLASEPKGQQNRSTTVLGASGGSRGLGQQRLASTLTNVMFPEANNFISFRTFKQLRYLKSISDYFALNHDAQEQLCQNLTSTNQSQVANKGGHGSRFELIDYQLNTSEKLFSLLCHYHSSQWLTVMNIVLSRRTVSLSKKTNYMTKYLSMFTRNFNDNENLHSFIHGQQLENIEAVANTTVVYLIALSRPFRTLKMSKISNMSWHSLPNLLDQIDGHLCLSKFDGNSSAYQPVVYEPKKPDIETILCKLPSWNISQVYNYFSENIDLQNMISLVAQNNRTAALFGISLGGSDHTQASAAKQSTNITINVQQQQITTRQPKTCITPFKFASKWLKIVQDLIDETMSKGSRDKIHKCLGANKKNQSIYSQTLRYLKLFNSAISTLNDLTVNNSWHFVRKTWGSISYALLNQTSSPPLSPASSSLSQSSGSLATQSAATQQYQTTVTKTF